MTGFSVADWRAIGDGTADASPAFQACVTAADSAGLYSITVPHGSYRLATPVVFPTGKAFRIRGVTSTATEIIGDAGVFSFPDAAAGTEISHMRLRASTGDVLGFGATSSANHLHHLVMYAPVDGSAVNVDGSFIDSTIEQCWVYHNDSATRPSLWMHGPWNNINTIRNCRFTNSGDYQIRIESTAAQAYASDNVVENINHEVPTGGAIDLAGCLNTTLRNCMVYDPVTPGPTHPYYRVGRSAAGLASKLTTIDQVGRRGQGPDAGPDVELEPSSGSGLIRSCHAVPAALTVDVGGNKPIVIDTGGLLELTNAGNATVIDASGG